MAYLKSRKSLLLKVIIVTSVAPLLFVRPEEAGVGMTAIKYLAKIGSLAGVILLFWQMLLGFRGMLAKLIPDYIWVIGLHKAVGAYSLPLILLHPIFITAYYLIKFDRNVLLLEGSTSFQWYVLCGVAALAVMIVLVVTSVFLRSRLSRHVWYSIHLSSYVVLPLVFIHSFPIGMTVNETALWGVWVVLVFVLVALLVFRILARLGAFSVKYQVNQVEQLAPDVSHIRMRPVSKHMAPDHSQFGFVRRGIRGSARPFTISGFDEATGEIAITVQAVGQMSSELQDVQEGETMYVDGPYGVFGVDAMAGDRPIVMIAGGIGITAFKRMIEELATEPQREAYLFYGSRNQEEMIYTDELEDLSHVNVIPVMSEDSEYPGEQGFITVELMQDYLAESLESYEFLLCGPPVMVNKLEEALCEARVPREQIHHELFGY